MGILDQLPHNSPDLFTNNIFGQRRYKTESSLTDDIPGNSLSINFDWYEHINILPPN